MPVTLRVCAARSDSKMNEQICIAFSKKNFLQFVTDLHVLFFHTLSTSRDTKMYGGEFMFLCFVAMSNG